MEALKWIGIVLAAGFIGYFGRYLAMKLIERVERGKSAQPAKDTPPAVPPADKAAAKLEKKRAKQAAKAAKKDPPRA